MENKQMNMDEMDKVAGGTLHEPLQPKILKDEPEILKDVLSPKDNTKVPSPKLGEKDPTIIGDPTEGMFKK